MMMTMNGNNAAKRLVDLITDRHRKAKRPNLDTSQKE